MNLLKRTLVTDPKTRISVDGFLKHPFFTSTQLPKWLPVSCLGTEVSKEFIQELGLAGARLASIGDLGNSRLQMNSMSSLLVS